MGGRLFRAEHVDADDRGDLQTVTLLGQHGETLKKVHRVQPFGFHSNIPKGSHGFGLQFGDGQSGRLLNAYLGGEHEKHRPRDREVGSTILYDQNGSAISLVEKEMRYVHAKQAVHVVGGCTLTHTKDGFAFKGGRVTHDGRSIGSDHTHEGVQGGAGRSGAPTE